MILEWEFSIRLIPDILKIDSFEYLDQYIHVKKKNGVVEFANYV